MIQPLRKAHRTLFALLLVALPAALVAGLLARHSPRSLTQAKLIAASSPEVARKTASVQGQTLEVVFFHPLEQTWQFELRSATEPVVPDGLLYWSAENEQKNLSLSAQLVGPVVLNHRYTLQPGSAPRGFLLFYSLAHHQLLGSLPLGGNP